MKTCNTCGKPKDEWENPNRKSKYCSKRCFYWAEKNLNKKYR